MTAPSGKATAESRIRALIEDQAKAIPARDIEGSVASYAQDVLLFDVVNPLRAVGLEALRGRLAEWSGSFDGPIGYELRHLGITAGADAAFAYSLNRIDATTIGGRTLKMWRRATLCWRRIEGAWVATHAHASVPFDAGTGRASLDLEP
jgi:ketosteroid isomerase-like protein